jgi:tetratricopeptide (TPR) repeat protein
LPYVYRGGIRRGRGQFKEATVDLKRGVQLCGEALLANPDDWQAYRARALAYRTLEQYDRAIEDYGQMIRVVPESVEAYVERGRTHAKKQDKAASAADFNEAVKLATTAIERRPQDAQAYRLRTEAYDAKAFAWHEPDDFRRAIADLDAIVRLAPDCPTVYFRRGHLCAGASHFAGDDESGAHFKQAEADCGEVIRLDPAYAVAWQERGLLYTRAALRNRERRLAVFGIKADLGEVVRTREALRNRERRLALRGVADLAEVIRLDPKAAGAYCARGSAHGLAGDFDRALADFTEAIRLCPEMADAHELRGGANLALKDKEAAQADLARAQELRNAAR